MTVGEHHYALDASSLVESCRNRLRPIIVYDKRKWHSNLNEIDEALRATEVALLAHLLCLLHRERLELSRLKEPAPDGSDGDEIEKREWFNGAAARPTLRETALDLRCTVLAKQRLEHRAAASRSELRCKCLQHWQGPGRADYRRGGQGGQNLHGHRLRDLSSRDDDMHYRGAVAPPPGIFRRTIAPHPSLSNSQYAGDSSNEVMGQLYPKVAGTNPPRGYRSTSDSMLFRLIVALQLCLVRIEEANVLICGGRAVSHSALSLGNFSALSTGGETNVQDESDSRFGKHPSEVVCTQSVKTTLEHEGCCRRRQQRLKIVGVGLVATGAAFVLGRRARTREGGDHSAAVCAAAKTLAAAAAAGLVRRGWRLLCMTARLSNSACTLEEWRHQWLVLMEADSSFSLFSKEGVGYVGTSDVVAGPSAVDDLGEKIDAKTRRLIECIPLQSNESCFWHSRGALRFFLLKRAMDTLYASVGTAVEFTKGSAEREQKPSAFWMPLVTAAAASYYALTGPGTRAADVVSSSSSSEVIQNAWGMVSFPAIKQLSLQASRLLKGAAIAERMTICGVPCFVLCRNPFPALAAALKRFKRQQERGSSRLSTILENPNQCQTQYRRRLNHFEDYHTKNVIFHITGGGFFAHTIAGDLPYLIDWSAATDAVVICPEYALLPENTFPVAIDEITAIYCSIVSGDSAPLLGFKADRIVVTGESAGGNLGAALCVKLCIDHLVDMGKLSACKQIASAKACGETQPISKGGTCLLESDNNGGCISPAGEWERESPDHDPTIRLPDAIMLCCPALNLSLEVSPSRILGTDDPVLPSGLISAISGAYLPAGLGVSKTNPVASPYYAPDDILCLFPPTLLFASSYDPLLDDSVDFNTRLQQLGVESDLRAAHHMPHAYWGLGTAGFPEAKQVQLECQTWLFKQLKQCGKEQRM